MIDRGVGVDPVKLREMAIKGLNLYVAQCSILLHTLNRGGRKVTWASIKASSDDYGCAIFCGQTLFCTGTSLSGGKFNHLFIARVPNLQLEIALYYNANFSWHYNITLFLGLVQILQFPS